MLTLSFENHEAVWLFWLVPILMTVFLVFENIRTKRLGEFVDLKNLKQRLPEYGRWSSWLRVFCFVLTIMFFTVAALRPYNGFETREVMNQGVDLYFLVDLSPSMNTQDIKPNRLARARFEMKDFLKLFRGDRVGLIGFSGEAYTFVPLTSDYEAFDLFLDELDTDLIPSHGTDIAGAISLAVESLKKREVDAAKAVVLITDGEDSVGLDEKTVQEIRQYDIRVYVVGVGTPDGAPVPRAEGDYITDADGKIVVSRLNEQVLENLALATDGGYVRSVGSDADIKQIYNGIRKKTGSLEGQVQERKLLKHVFQPFLLLGLFFLMLEFLITPKRHYWLGKILFKKT